jgi:hypothetical protein
MPKSSFNCCHHEISCKPSCNTFQSCSHAPSMLSGSISVQPTLFYACTPMHAQTILYANNCCTGTYCCTNDCCADSSSDEAKKGVEEKLIKQEIVHQTVKASESITNESIVKAELKVDEKINEARKKIESYENEVRLSRLREEDLRKRLSVLEVEQSKFQAKTSSNVEVSTHIQGSQTKESSLNKKCCCSLNNGTNHCDYCSSHSHNFYNSSCYENMEEKLRNIRDSINCLLVEENHRLKREKKQADLIKINKSKDCEICEEYEFDTCEAIVRPKPTCSGKIISKPPWRITGVLNSTWENRHKYACRPSSEMEIVSSEKRFKKNDKRLTELSTGRNEHNQFVYHEIPVIYTRNNLKNEIKSIRPKSKSYHRNCAKNSDYCWKLKLDELENFSKPSEKPNERIIYSYKESRPTTSFEFRDNSNQKNYYEENIPKKIEMIRKEIQKSSSCPASGNNI